MKSCRPMVASLAAALACACSCLASVIESSSTPSPAATDSTVSGICAGTAPLPDWREAWWNSTLQHGAASYSSPTAPDWFGAYLDKTIDMRVHFPGRLEQEAVPGLLEAAFTGSDSAKALSSINPVTLTEESASSPASNEAVSGYLEMVLDRETLAAFVEYASSLDVQYGGIWKREPLAKTVAQGYVLKKMGRGTNLIRMPMPSGTQSAASASATSAPSIQPESGQPLDSYQPKGPTRQMLPDVQPESGRPRDTYQPQGPPKGLLPSMAP